MKITIGDLLETEVLMPGLVSPENNIHSSWTVSDKYEIRVDGHIINYIRKRDHKILLFGSRFHPRPRYTSTVDREVHVFELVRKRVFNTKELAVSLTNFQPSIKYKPHFAERKWILKVSPDCLDEDFNHRMQPFIDTVVGLEELLLIPVSLSISSYSSTEIFVDSNKQH